MGHRHKMYFDRERTISADVFWYRAPPGAKTLGFASPFVSETWDSVHWGTSGPGEDPSSPSKYWNSAPLANVKGQQVCGPLNWFEFGAPSGAKPLKRNGQGTPWCCLNFSGFLLGASFVAKRFAGSGCACAVGHGVVGETVVELGHGCACAVGHGYINYFLGHGCACAVGHGVVGEISRELGYGCACAEGHGVVGEISRELGYGCACAEGHGVEYYTSIYLGAGCACAEGHGVEYYTSIYLGAGCACAEGHGVVESESIYSGHGCACASGSGVSVFIGNCSYCSSGTTRLTWTFTGTGFTGVGTVFNATITLIQNPSLPCQWNWGLPVSGTGAQLNVGAGGSFNLQLYVSGSFEALYYAPPGSVGQNCSTAKTLPKQVSFIGGAASLTLTPA